MINITPFVSPLLQLPIDKNKKPFFFVLFRALKIFSRLNINSNTTEIVMIMKLRELSWYDSSLSMIGRVLWRLG